MGRVETIEWIVICVVFVLVFVFPAKEGASSLSEESGASPIKPTSGSWRKDAEALLETGARSIDASTVRALLEEDDRLDQMWEQQEAFMRLLQDKRNFPQFPTDLTSKKGQQFLKDIRNHLMEELFEAGQHLKNAKSHRATDVPEVDREAYKEELVDALHLYFELVIASGITAQELVDAYLKKGATNFERIRTGY